MIQFVIGLSYTYGNITMTNMYPDMKITILTIFFYLATLHASALTLNNSDTIMSVVSGSEIMTERKVELSSVRAEWKAKTKGYEHCVFYCGKKCGEDFVQTNRELTDYIKVKHGHNALRSMLMP